MDKNSGVPKKTHKRHMDNQEKDNANQKDKNNLSYRYDPVLFHADYSIYILYKRIDNLAAAIYLVTNTLPETESLKTSLRTTSLNCLAGIVSYIGKANADVSSLQNLVAHVLQLSSLINITFWSGMISEMNSTVLQKEVTKINETLGQIISRYRSKMMIDSTFFSSVDLEHRQFKNNVLHTVQDNQVIVNKGHYKRQEKDIKEMVSRSLPSSNINDSESKMKRRETILQLLSEKSNLSIKDFAAVIQTYSEKTIQRELLAMVEEGLLKKQGERRWSTYSRS